MKLSEPLHEISIDNAENPFCTGFLFVLDIKSALPCMIPRQGGKDMEKNVLTKPMLGLFIVMNFVLNMSASLFNGILDQVALEMNVPVTVTGQLTSMYAYGAGIGVPLFLILAGKFKRENLLKCMLGLNMIITLIMCFTYQFEMMLVTRFLMGFAGTCYGVLASATVAVKSPKDQIGKYLSLLIAGSAVAMIIGIPAIRLLSGFMGWRQISMGLVIIMGVALAGFCLGLKAEGNSEQQMKIRNELEFLKSDEVLMVLCISLITFMGYGMQVYLAPYLSELFPSMAGRISLILMIIGIASFLGNMAGGTVCDRIGYRKALTLGTGIQAVTALAILFTQFNAVLNVALIVLWMGNAWFVGLQLNTGINVAVQSRSRFVISLNSSAIQLGSAMGAGIVAAVINLFGMGIIPVTSCITSIICCMIAAFVKTKKK